MQQHDVAGEILGLRAGTDPLPVEGQPAAVVRATMMQKRKQPLDTDIVKEPRRRVHDAE